jgi:hypothetical protein
MARRLEDETIILDTVSGSFFRLNSTGSLIWSLLATASAVDDVVAQLAAMCGVGTETVEQDVQELMGALEERGLISLAP